MTDRQSLADAFAGFLAPESVPKTSVESASLTRWARQEIDQPVKGTFKPTNLLAALADGGPHESESIRVATGLPTLKFAAAVAALRRKGLIAVEEDGGRELLMLTDAGAVELK